MSLALGDALGDTLGDALAEGSAPDSAPEDTTREWTRCRERGSGSAAICPDGYVEVNQPTRPDARRTSGAWTCKIRGGREGRFWQRGWGVVGDLAGETCAPCRGGEPAPEENEIGALLLEVPGWRVAERDGVKRLEKGFRFADFASALRFTIGVGESAEEAGHHPALLTEWGRVTVGWWTHAIGGLHRNDFVMAARTDTVYAELLEDDGPNS